MKERIIEAEKKIATLSCRFSQSLRGVAISRREHKGDSDAIKLKNEFSSVCATLSRATFKQGEYVMPVESELLVGNETRLIVTTIDILSVLDVGQCLLSLEEAYLSLRRFELFAEKARKRGRTLSFEKMDSLILQVLDIKTQRTNDS